MKFKEEGLKKVLYILTMMTLVGCYSNNCPVNNTVTCNYKFYDSEGTAITYENAITVSAILPGTKQVYAYRLWSKYEQSDTKREDLINEGYHETIETVRRDTVLINKAAEKTLLQIPMSYFNEADTLLFWYEGISLPDSIYIKHDSYPHVDLPECGSFRYHDLKDIKSTNNAIDHIEIVNSTVNYDQEENVKIYFNGVVSTK